MQGMQEQVVGINYVHRSLSNSNIYYAEALGCPHLSWCLPESLKYRVKVPGSVSQQDTGKVLISDGTRSLTTQRIVVEVRV